MTAAEPTPLRRPPIRQSTVVRSDPDHTFDVFVRRIGEWWPVRPYSIGEENVASVTFEPRVGGRVYETWGDGREVPWGHVTAWDPPRGFSMTWEVFSAVTDVELIFRPLGPALTRVEVEHRGWERLSDEECAALATGPNRYDTGWATVLAAFAATFES